MTRNKFTVITQVLLLVGFSSFLSAADKNAVAVAVETVNLPQTVLRVLSYNIQALPPPIKSGKEPLFVRISELLRERRAQGNHPHVVLLQEAFDSKSNVIVETSGYKYVLKGPGRKKPAKLGEAHWVPKTRKAYVSFTDPQKFMGSGLVILSDYPILAGMHKAFNSDECAGLDCLANKSIQMARIEVPGVKQPVDVVNSHFNSHRSAAAPRQITLKMHHKQTDKLHWFLGKVGQGNPMIVAGDFNTKQADRYAYFDKILGLFDAAKICLSSADDCRIPATTETDAILYNTNDKHFYVGTSQVSVQPSFIERNFDEKLHGRELSDHLGYEVHYMLSSGITTSG